MNQFEKQSRAAMTETNLMQQFVERYFDSLAEAEEFVNSDRGLHVFKLIEVGYKYKISNNPLNISESDKNWERCSQSLHSLQENENWHFMVPYGFSSEG